MNRPFAACHSRGTKPPCWNAKVALEQDQQKAYIIWNSNFLCFSCPSATFASQHGSFVPREWQATKVLSYQTTSVVYVIFTAILHCHDITLKNSFTDRQFSMQTKLLAWTKQSLFSLLLTEHMVRKQTQSYVGNAKNVSSCSTVESEDIKNTFASCVGGSDSKSIRLYFPNSWRIQNVLLQVCTGYGKPGKSWNLRISCCRPEKSWNLLVGHGKWWKILKSFIWWISYRRWQSKDDVRYREVINHRERHTFWWTP